MSRRQRNPSALTAAGMLALLGIVPGAPIERAAIEGAIERLVAVPDEIDGDADLELDVGEEREEGDEDFEPSLGWSRTMAVSRYDSAPLTLDFENWFAEVAA